MLTKITLPTPSSNQHQQVSIVPETEITLDFNTGAASFEREGADLHITHENGGSITITNFFVAANTESLPVFALPDGQQVASADFLKNFSIDVSTAAGPSASPTSSGVNSYEDGAGDLLTGVDTLGSLGTNQWANQTNTPDTLVANAGSGDLGGETPPPLPPTPPTPPTPPAPGTPAVMRFVMLLDEDQSQFSSASMTGTCKEANNNKSIGQIATKYGIATIAADGTIGFELNEDVRMALGAGSAPLIDYIIFTDASGRQYSVQVVITNNPNYADDNSIFDTYGTINREVHSGNVIDSNYNTSSGNKLPIGDGDDTLTYNGLTGGSVYSGNGNDSITINSSTKNSLINSGNGNNVITINDITTTRNAHGVSDSEITSGTGNDSITITASTQANNAYGMENSTLTTGTGNDTVKIQAASITGEAVGMLQSSATLGGTGSVIINSVSENANAYAMQNSTITGGDTATLTATAGANAYGMHGNSSIINVESVTITSNGQKAFGMTANTGNTNAINNANTVLITATGSTGAIGIEGVSGSNTIYANQLDVQATTTSGTAKGLTANGATSVNEIHTKTANIIATSTDGTAYGVQAMSNAKNSMTSAGNTTITAKSTNGTTYGVQASNTAENTITSGGKIEVTSTSATNWAAGLDAASAGSKNTLTAGGDIHIKAQSGGTSATAVHSFTGTETNLKSGGSVTLEALGVQNHSYGISNYSNVTINAQKDVSITSVTGNTGASEATGISGGVTTNITATTGNIGVSATGNTAFGATAKSGGVNILTATQGTVTLEAHGANNASGTGNTGNAAALYASDWNQGTAKNIITGKNVIIKADTAVSGDTYAMYADAATNKITATDTVFVSAENNGSGNAYGMHAITTNSRTGSNTINGGNVTVTSLAQSGTAIGLSANKGVSSSSGGTNTINNAKSVDITAESVTGSAYGLNAIAGGKNQVTTDGNANIAATSKTISASGLHASGGGSENTVTSNNGNTISIAANAGMATVSGLRSWAMGVNSTSGGTNKLQGNLDIIAHGQVSAGISSTSTGKNIIGNQNPGDTGAYNITVNAGYTKKPDGTIEKGSSTETYGIYSLNGTTVVDTKGNVVLNANALGTTNSASAMGIYSATGGGATIKNANLLNITASGNNQSIYQTSSTGVYAISNSVNKLENIKDITIATNTTGNTNSAYGVQAQSGGTNYINAEASTTQPNTIKIDAHTVSSGTAHGVMASASNASNAANYIGNAQTTNVSITASSTSGKASGMSVSSANTANALNVVTGKVVNITASTTSGTASGISATNSGTGLANNVINAHDAKITATSQTGQAFAINANEKGSNTITATGSVDMVVTTGGYATGIYNYKGSNGASPAGNTINAGEDVNLTVTSNSTTSGAIGAVGMVVWGSTNTINANNGTINLEVTSNNTGAQGVSAWGNGENILNGNDINITVEGHEVTYPGSNTYVGAVGAGANGVGAKNTFTVDSSFDLTVTNDAGGTSRNSAMGLTASNGGVNTIQAAEGSQGIEVHITVAAGSGGKAYALYASKDASGNIGTNQIIGNAGNDFISIKGDVYSDGYGKNIIDLSKGGNNTVVLDGVVSKDGLTLIPGAGHDTLVLKAATQADFNLKFKSWLTNLYSSGIAIEEINILVSPTLSEAERTSYLEYVQSLFPAGDRDKISLIDEEPTPYSAAPAMASAFAAHAEAPETQQATAETNQPQGVNDPMVAHAASASPMLLAATSTADAPDNHTAPTQNEVITIHGDVQNETLAFTPGMHETLHIDGSLINASVQSTNEPLHLIVDQNYQADANHTLVTGNANDTIEINGTVNGDITLGNGNDVLLIGNLETGTISLGEGADWAIVGGMQQGATLEGDGNDTLVLKLHGTDGLDLFDLSGVSNIQSFWLDLADSGNDTIDGVFLENAFKTLGEDVKEMYILRDETDITALEGSGWVKHSEATQTTTDYNGNTVTFDTYIQGEGSEALSLYVQQIAGM